MDREGNPSFNPILNPNDIKDEFNATDPVDDVKNYLQQLSETLQRHGYAQEEADAAARTLLPDVLHYDRTLPAHYPNGRVMTDDVFSTRMIFMTHGGTPQLVGPHDDLLPHFPYLAHPTRNRPARPSPLARKADNQAPMTRTSNGTATVFRKTQDNARPSMSRRAGSSAE